jgi:hypothetical protein
MPIFDKKSSFSRPELKNSLRRDTGIIPRTGGQRFRREERESLEKEVFGSKYGSQISKYDYRSAVKGLRDERAKTQDSVRRIDLDKKINYLKRIGGV